MVEKLKFLILKGDNDVIIHDEATFDLRTELTGAIAQRLLHSKNQLSAPGSFFNQFITEIYIQSTPLNRATA